MKAGLGECLKIKNAASAVFYTINTLNKSI